MSEPHSANAERAVISMMYASPVACRRVLSELVSEDFYNVGCKLLFEIAQDIANDFSVASGQATMSAVLLSDAYAEQIEKVGGIEFVRAISSTPIDSLDNLDRYVLTLKTRTLQRKKLRLVTKAVDDIANYNGIDYKHVFNAGLDELSVLNTEYGKRFHDYGFRLSDGLDDYLEHIGENQGYAVGWPCFDARLGLFRPGELYYICSRPKRGKSTLGLTWMCNLGIRGVEKNGGCIPVACVATEMTKEEQYDKMLAHISNVDVDTIHSGDYKQDQDMKDRVAHAVDVLKTSPVYWRRSLNDSPATIASDIRRSVVELGAKIVFFDCFKAPSDSSLYSNMREYQIVGQMVNMFKDLAENLAIPIVAFGHTNRDSDESLKDNAAPVAASIGGGDRILRHCTSVIHIKKMSREDIMENGGIDNGNSFLTILENRHGDCHEDGTGIFMRYRRYNASMEELSELTLMDDGDFT